MCLRKWFDHNRKIDIKKRHSEWNGVFDILLCQCVDLFGKTRLLARCSVLMVDVVCSRLIDGLVCRNEEGFRLIRIAGGDSVIDAADRTADARLLCNIARAALGVRLYTQNRCLDVWQIVHPLD